MKAVKLGFFSIFCLLSACKQQNADPRLNPGIDEAPTVPASTRFELLSPERSGINFIPVISDEHRYNFLADPNIYNGGGVAVLDVNNDGLQDLLFTARLQGCQLYLNKGGLRFEDISKSSGIAAFGGLKTGAVVIDINGDGWQDVYICRTWLEPVPERRNLLLINNKDNTFSEKAAEYKLDDISASQHANFFDYDLDGDLDCHIVNYPVDFKTINNLDAVNGRSQGPRKDEETDRLLKNMGTYFEDVTEKAGLKNRAFGLSSIAADFNNDGWPDIFVANDFVMPDFLYINNQDGTFSDRAEQYFRHTSNHTMGSDMADINGDGWGDLIGVDMLAEPLERRHRLMNTMQLSRDKQMRERGYGRQVMRNVLQLNNGNQGFSEIACLAGVEATDWSWAPLLADFDNDGHCDIFISNGIQRDLNDLDFFVFTADSINRTGGINKSRFPDFNDFVKLMPSEPVHNYLFQNNGSLQFDDVSAAWGFDKKGFSNGAAYSDLDNDGDLDLIVNNLQAPASIYENKAVGLNGNNWLQIKCTGTDRNPFGIGAKVSVYGGAAASAGIEAPLLFYQEISNVRGFYSSVEPILQIGLGDLQKVDKIQVEWSEGRHQILSEMPANQRVVLKISDAKPGKAPRSNNRDAYNFEELTAASGLSFKHRENDFEDFDREKLLPYRLSKCGPSISVGDVHGDALEDVFIGNAAGQAGTIFLQNAAGNFTTSQQEAFEADKNHEDTASAFFDADGDGDLDLYLVSGGNEVPAGSALYQDRLYLNDGKGKFSRAKNALPTETFSGSCIQVFDFDSDGKMDVFVGGRAVPGRFPEATESMILKNEGGIFKNVTASVAPGFQKPGMVTDLQFGDLNGDGKPELVVAGDWMPIRIFQWDGRKFEDKTADYGLQNSSGLWRCISLADIDGDGDLDIAAGNLGQNTRFHASAKAPLRVFANDFDKNGSLDPILALAEGGKYKPAVQRETLASQVPSIKKRFPRNAPYAKATLTDIFDAQDLLAGICLEAQMLETMWFRNDGGKFTACLLPDYAQFAPVEKIVAADMTGDGIVDLLTLGNDYDMEIETYLLDAGDGFLFVGSGKGEFAQRPLRLGSQKAARDAAFVRNLSGERRLLVANNNDNAQVFKLLGSKN